MATEFPDLGANCSMRRCRQLDFLPMKCDACRQIFCSAHIMYDQHTCSQAHTRDAQVPVCPLCNRPVPIVVKGTPVDVVVGRHIDSDCTTDIAKRRIYTNRCHLIGCKRRELVPIKCGECQLNYCVKHRHAADHNCSKATTSSANNGRAGQSCSSQHRNAPKTAAVDVSNDEAFARALQMADNHGTLTQEDIDAALAESLQREEYAHQQHGAPVGERRASHRNCSIS